MNDKRHAVIWIGMLLLVAALPICAEDEPGLYGGPPDPAELATRQAGLSGLGLTFINGDPFFRFQLQPEIAVGKVGVGLDVVLLYDPDPDLKPDGSEGDKILAEDGEEWDNLSTILRSIRYVRYGRPNDPFFARFGELDYVTIGHGLIMGGYSNYDRRGLRLNLSTETKKVGVETIVNNLGDPTIFGARLYVRPLQREGGPAIINRLEFGATYLTDIDPAPMVEDEDPLIALGVDVGLPIISSRLLNLTLYDDLAFLNTKRKLSDPTETETAAGNAVGAALSITNILLKLEYRTFARGFVPTLFDYTYEASKQGNTISGVPDFVGLDPEEDDEARRGYYSMVAWQPVPKVHLLGSFEDYSNSEPKMYLGVAETGLVDRVSFRAFYVKRNIGEPDPGFPEAADSEDPEFFEDLFRLDEKSAFTVRVGYEVFPSVELAVTREYRFRQTEDADGEKIFEPIQKTSVELGLHLGF